MADNLDNLVEIQSDKYSMHDKWTNDIASKYLDIDDITNLKVGLYGYINEVIATNLRYSVAHRNFLYDEAFLNTASLTKSIYNKAKTYNYDIPLAKPASLKIQFSIRSNSIFEFGDRETEIVSGEPVFTGNYTFRISEWDKFYIDKYPFMLEDDIVIKATKLKDGTYAYSATYDRSRRKDNKGIFSGSTKPYVTLWVDRATSVNNYDIITLQFPIYQINKEIINFSNFSNDFSDNLFFNQEYSDYLCHFDVWYNTQSLEILMDKYFNDIYTPDDEYYYYYNFDGNSVNIYFSALAGAFKPAINSRLDLYLYTTLGDECNITYNGGITHSFNNNDLNAKIPININKVTNPNGGVNGLTKSEIKNNLIEEFLTRDNLVTQYDLDCYFNNLLKKEVVNSSKMTFIKKRDDIKKRTYASFLLLRDKSGLIIPTNTIDLDLSPLNIEEEFNIQCGSLIGYKEDRYVVFNENTKKLIKENIDDKNVEPNLVGIFVSKNPNKLIYNLNDTLNLEGLEVSGIYDNNTINNITNFTIKNFDSSSEGIKSLKIFYSNNEEIYTILNIYVVNDERAVISSVSIKEPTKKRYKLNEELDLSGLEVKVFYNDGSSRILSDDEYTLSDFDNTKIGNQIITINFEYVKINFSVEVIKNPELVRIEALSLPKKLEYFVNETLDLQGLIIKAVYDDETISIVDLENVEISGFNSNEASTNNIEIKYEGKTLNFDVIIKELEITSIYVKHVPNEIFYTPENPTLNTDGLEIYANYNNGTNSILNPDEYYTNGINTNIIGIQEIEVYYIENNNISCKFKVYYNDGSQSGGSGSGGSSSGEDSQRLFITAVRVLHNLNQTIYPINTEINLEGLTLLATLSDGSTEEIVAENDMVDVGNYQSNIIGKQNIPINYSGFKVYVTVYFEADEETPERHLNDISIQSYPNKMIYALGDEFDTTLEGLVVNAVYSNGDVIQIDNSDLQLIYNSFNNKVEDYYTISIRYNNFEKNFIVRVADIPIYIYINKYPNKMIYNVLDVDQNDLNLPVNMYYNDKDGKYYTSYEEHNEDGVTVPEYEGEINFNEYRNYSIFYNVTTEKYFRLVKYIDNDTYALENYDYTPTDEARSRNELSVDKLDLTGLEVNGVYKDGRNIGIIIESKDIDKSNFDITQPGSTSITINKYNLSITINYVVINVSDSDIINESIDEYTKLNKNESTYNTSLDPTRAIISTLSNTYEDDNEEEINLKYDYGHIYHFQNDDREFVEYKDEYESFKDQLEFVNKASYRLIDNVSYNRNDERELLVYTDEIKEIFNSDDYNINIPESEIITINNISYIPTKYQTIYEMKYNLNKKDYENQYDEIYPLEKALFNSIKTTVYVQFDEHCKELVGDLYNNEVYTNYNYYPPMSCIVYKDEYASFKDELNFVESSYNCVLIKDIVVYVEYNSMAENLIEGNYDRIYYFDNSLVPYIKYSDDYKAYRSHLTFMNRSENEIIKYIKFDKDTQILLEDNDFKIDNSIAFYYLEDGTKYIQYLDEYSEFIDNLKFIDVDYKLNYLKPESDYSLVYRIPYAVHYKKDPFPRIVTIRNNMNTDLYFNFSYYNANIISQYIIEYMNIERSSITYDRLVSDNIEYTEEGKLFKRTTVITDGYTEKTTILTYDDNENVNSNNSYSVVTNNTNKYFLTFNLDTNALADFKTAIESNLAELDDLTEYVFKTDEDFYKYLLDNEIIKCRCLIKNKNKEDLGYFDFICDDYSTLKFHYELVTNNFLDSANRLCLVNCIYDITKENAGTLLNEFYLEEEVYLEICILNKIIDKYNEPKPIMPVPLNYCTDINNDNYTLAVKFLSNIPFKFFTLMNDIIAPILDMKQNSYYTNSEKGFYIKGLPVVGKHYLYNYKVFQDFFNLFSLYYDTLDENFSKLENNTSVNMKFYNTYGYSDNWSSNSTNITLNLIIKLVDSYTPDLDFKIKNYILDFVEKVNDTSSKVFAISNLIKGLEKEFSDIKYIEFVSLDDSEEQVVTNNTPSIQDMTSEQLINYVPEYLNITIGKDAYIEGKNNFVTGISIKYI